MRGEHEAHTADAWYGLQWIYLQVFHDTEHNLHQLGAEDGTLSAHTQFNSRPLFQFSSHPHTRAHTHACTQKESALQMTGKKWWWLTIMGSKVRNTQMELELCHRWWWVVLLIYVPYRWCVAFCQLCPAGEEDKNTRHRSELVCWCLAGTLLSGLSQAFVASELMLHGKQLHNTELFKIIMSTQYARNLFCTLFPKL